MLRGRLHFLEILGVAVSGGDKAQIIGRKVADRVAVHRQLRGARRGHDGEAFLLQFGQYRSADRLDLGDDVIGPVLLGRLAQLVAIEHGEHFACIGQLHGGRIVIAVAGDDIGAKPLGRDRELAPQFARAEQEDPGGVAHAASSAASSP